VECPVAWIRTGGTTSRTPFSVAVRVGVELLTIWVIMFLVVFQRSSASSLAATGVKG
jgi:hypothetical protein